MISFFKSTKSTKSIFIFQRKRINEKIFSTKKYFFWSPDSALTVLMNGHFKVVTGELDKLPEGSTFVYVDVGGRDYWKNKSNEFR